MSALTVTVLGEPVPQGSMKSLGPRRLVHSNAEKLRPWRDTVAWQVQQTMRDLGIDGPLEGPLSLTATFTLPRPQSAPRSRWAPHKKPDGDKLLRGLFDAITAGGGWVDDAQVVRCEWSKVYPVDGALPGVTFTVAPAVRGEQVSDDDRHRRPVIHNPGVHKPFTDDGVTYCGHAGDGGVWEGCGTFWPCSTVRARRGDFR